MSTFDVDAIKLDQSMISRLASDPRNRMIVRSIIRLCVMLGIHVVAEGVETESARDFLRTLGCEEGQGYLFAKPMPMEKLVNWLSDNRTASRDVA